MTTEILSEELRRKAFRALVILQDEGCPVEESRAMVAEQFSLDLRDIQMIEREGISKEWPPL